MIAQALRLDPMIFIIDKGGSYDRICDLFGGQYFTVDLDHPLAVNPFAGELTREKQALLTTLIVAMATRNDEREHLDSERVGIVEEALVKLYQRVKDREIQLSDLAEVLVKDYGERGKGLRQRLFAFTREGQFGMFFDRPNELKAHSSFNVFDLKRLDGYPELQASFLLVTMNFIISSIQSTDPGRPKYLFIDEAWALLKNEASARYVAEAFQDLSETWLRRRRGQPGGERFSCRPRRENHFTECANQNSSAPGAGNGLDAQRRIEAIAGGGRARKLRDDGAGSEIRVLSENELGQRRGNSLSLADHVLGHDY